MIDLRLLNERFGIPRLRPFQELVIEYILSHSKGKLLAVLPTGGGKSLCFMYPLAVTGKRALLVYPLKALMHDQKRRLDACGLPSVVLEGGLSREERRKRLRIAREPGVSIITNLEMLLYLTSENISIVRDIPVMVIDEAHTIVTWGETFRESFLELPRIINIIKPSLVLAFTATADEATKEGMRRLIFSGEEPFTIIASSDRENIFYHSVHSLSKTQDIKALLKSPSSRPALVFCRSRKETESLSEALSGDMEIMCYHAGLSAEERKEKEDWFLHSHGGVMAATSAYGMGVDKRDIRTVIHTSLPDSALDYLQESGRGGRDGKRTDSYVLWYGDEESPIVDVFKSKSCIRTALLHLMDEERKETRCNACSSCAEDGYIPAGMRESMRYIHLHPFISRKRLPTALFSRLRGWTLPELSRATDELIAYGFIRLYGQRLFLRKKIWYNFLKKKGAE